MNDDLIIEIEDDPMVAVLEGPADPVGIDVATPDLKIRLRQPDPILAPEEPAKEEMEIVPVVKGAKGDKGDQGDPGVPGVGGTSAEQVLVEFLAAQDLLAFDPVTLVGTIGDSDDLSQRGKVIGISMFDVSSGATGQALIEGEIENPLWSWSPGTRIYLNGTTLSATPPSTGYSQRIAVAETDMTIVIQPQPPILL